MLSLIRNLTKQQTQLHSIVQKNFQSTNVLHNRIEIFVDDNPIKVDPQYTIFQACHEAGVIIPRFCYHERLSVAGNCRMCLVEVEKSPKPVAACTAQVMPGMRIKTKSEQTRVHRGSVMEFLLANHPLDCPICDQGGECDLQDIAQVYGYGEGRYREYKRAVQDKNLGPLISTHMNRCIHCTRCVRFASEVAGVIDLGKTGRGKFSEIGTYVDKLVTSELSGNLVDICPVGALTNGPYAYTSRPWELKGYYSIDVLDGLGQNIQVDTRGSEIMRILPRINEEVNQEWIDDKARHAYDGLKRQRLTNPLKRGPNGDFENIDWEEAITTISKKLQNVSGNDVAGVIGDQTDIESITAFKDLLNRLDSDNFHFTGKGVSAVKPDLRSSYIMNSRITGIEDTDLLLLVGTNPKYEAPILNARILKAVNNNKLKVFTIGSPFDLSYSTVHLGNSASILGDIASGKHPFAQRLGKAKLPSILVGSGTLERQDGQGIYNNLLAISKSSPVINQATGWNGFNVLHREASRVGALDIGIQESKPENLAKAKFVFLLGADNNLQPESISKDAFVVYLGTHGDEGAYYADIVLPSAAYTEKTSTFVNTEGRVQLTRLAVTSPGNSKNDWEILRAISEEIGCTLPYDNVEELRYRIAELAPHLMKYDYIEPSVLGQVALNPGQNTQLNNTPLIDEIDNFYQTDSISRSSVTMAKCSTAFNQDKFTNFRN